MFFSSRFVLDIAEYAQSRGLSKDRIFDLVPHPPEELSKRAGIVQYEVIADIMALIDTELKAPAFGLQMGEQIDLKATMYIEQLMDSSQNVQEAFEQAIVYSKLISDSMFCSLQLSEDRFRVNFALNPDWRVQPDYAIIQNLDMALICTKNSLFRLTNQHYYPLEVHFFYPKPKKLSEHYRLFNCHLKFNASVSSIVFGKHILQAPTMRQNHGLLEQLQEEANIILNSLPQESSLLLKVKQLIIQHIHQPTYQIQQLAQDLHLSPRTLQRQLRSEQTSFKQLQQDLRFQLIKKCWNRGIRNLDEIAYLVGYSESSVLVRAFKQWTGTTPRKYLSNLR
ncbi:MAG: AraC family transcriptional regulator ligand-binding domain-containing protein [Bacteroidota bacterium]